MPLAPQIYEKVWRPRALSRLTGRLFPVSHELDLVSAWAAIRPGDLVVDLGTSTGLYARGLAHKTLGLSPAPRFVALDAAPGMLLAARSYARRDGLESLTYLRAMAERLPFEAASADVVVCGGSLNEFRSMEAALREARRVLKSDGRFVVMALTRAESSAGRLTQAALRASGIHFPGPSQLNEVFGNSGWQLRRQEQFGVVVFSLLGKI